MGVSVVSAAAASIGDSVGIKTFSFDAPTGANYIVVALAGKCNSGQYPGAVSWNGVDVPVQAGIAGPGDMYAGVYALVGATVADGTHDISVVVRTDYPFYARVYAGVAGGTPTIADSAGEWGASGSASLTFDGTDALGRVFGSLTLSGTNQSAAEGFTEDERLTAGDKLSCFGHEAADTSGDRTTCWTGNSSFAVVGVLIEEGVATTEPSALGFEWGVVAPGPTISVSEDITNYAGALGMEWGVVAPGPKVRPSGKRQIMLTGEGIETPEMTTGGTAGQVLSFSATGPTWIDAGGAPATTVTDETTWGITPAVGSASTYAKGDHTHGTPAEPAGSGVGPLLITDTPSTPLVFADLIQNDAQDDLVYSDL
jgi:hypothetical protein